MQITENSLCVNLNSKGNAMAVKVKREEEVSLTPRLRPFWCLSQSTTGSSQRNDIVDSSFQPGRALGAQSSKVQKLVLESWIPQRQKACIASIPISDLSQNWCSGLFNAWMNEWMNGQMFTLLWLHIVRAFKACSPKYLTLLPPRSAVYVSSLKSGLCGCLMSRIWWKHCYACFRAEDLRDSRLLSIPVPWDAPS